MSLNRQPLANDLLGQDNSELNKAQCLMTKTLLTSHFPTHPRAKEVKRVYGNFDKEIAYKMFGYRVKFNKAEMQSNDLSAWPSAS